KLSMPMNIPKKSFTRGLGHRVPCDASWNATRWACIRWARTGIAGSASHHHPQKSAIPRAPWSVKNDTTNPTQTHELVQRGWCISSKKSLSARLTVYLLYAEMDTFPHTWHFS